MDIRPEPKSSDFRHLRAPRALDGPAARLRAEIRAMVAATGYVAPGFGG